MFDIGFWEITLILVVALLVVGPERLPKLARTSGLWLGRIRSMVQTVKTDIDRELAAEDLKKTLSKQADSIGIHDIIEETKESFNEIKDSMAGLDNTLNENLSESSTPAVADKKDVQAIDEK
ncbi:MAG: twin-arginine translocase subunit TatB [Gammaproteobacteria bacterium]|nr:twin-arginine translocase subunit TatB [Gammaproteobacteria bacterium]